MKATDASRRGYRRRAVVLEVKITFRPPASFASGAGAERLMLVGRTKNISETGAALVVSARNIDRYLRAKDNTFDLELRLPEGAVALQAAAIYFSKTAVGSGATYLIGSRFTKANTQDHARLATFLRNLAPPA
ncbi:MAG TPA: PilZ domain-containing protein [Pyrinomonadaceae bacterium]|nr:PilZ domain-containing protein [Pyrinomonadaceae bacterium]